MPIAHKETTSLNKISSLLFGSSRLGRVKPVKRKNSTDHCTARGLWLLRVESCVSDKMRANPIKNHSTQTWPGSISFTLLPLWSVSSHPRKQSSKQWALFRVFKSQILALQGNERVVASRRRGDSDRLDFSPFFSAFSHSLSSLVFACFFSALWLPSLSLSLSLSSSFSILVPSQTLLTHLPLLRLSVSHMWPRDWEAKEKERGWETMRGELRETLIERGKESEIERGLRGWNKDRG